MQAMPEFMENEEWYTRIENDDGSVDYVLTDKAPQKAIESYEEFYKGPVLYDNDGESLCPEGWACA